MPKNMKIAIISDIHCNPSSDLHYWLETVTNDSGRHGSHGVSPATQAEVLARMGSGLHTENATLTICGHTHIPRVVSVVSPTGGQRITIVTPGSVALPAYDDIHPCQHHIETGSPHDR